MPVRDLSVETRPTKEVVVSSLTRDASVAACIFDLIDNSIDAARAVLVPMGDDEKDDFGLPKSYGGIQIDVDIGRNGVVVSDNCDGISSEELSKSVLRFGVRSKQPFGIGLYGVGLNRAIFKLGDRTELDSDNGSERVALNFLASEYLASPEWDLPAKALVSRGKPGTKIVISAPPKNVSKFISDRVWIDDFINESGKRYHRFVEKGLALRINKTEVKPVFIRLRENGPFPCRHKSYTTDDGVNVFLEAGQHQSHRFPAEEDFDRSTNNQLTDQYGWSVSCNDRLIVMCDTSEKTGWDKKWHPEFNGFVGYVWFTAEDGSSLPWNTSKSDVDVFSSIYQEALDDMRQMTIEWRSFGREAKKKRQRGEPLLAPGAKSTASEPGSSGILDSEAESAKPSSRASAGGASTKKKPGSKDSQNKPPVKKTDHNELRTVLPNDVDERHCKNKLLLLVHEAKKTDIYDCTYSALALVRMLFETSAIEYMIRIGRASEMREYCYNKHYCNEVGEAEKKIKKKDYQPSLDGICDFLLNADDIWGAEKSPYIRQSAEKFKKHKADLNSALHWPLRTIGFSTALEIRNEVLPILRHFIED